MDADREEELLLEIDALTDERDVLAEELETLRQKARAVLPPWSEYETWDIHELRTELDG